MKVTIERRGKSAQSYRLLAQVADNVYFAVKINGGERPRIVYLINIKPEDIRHDEKPKTKDVSKETEIR